MSTCRNMGDHLLVEVSGKYSLRSMLSTVYEVAEHCRKEGLKKVLVDLRNLDGNPNIFDRYLLGLEIARKWGPRIKAAILTRAEMANRMAENTAVNRGARIRVNASMDDALQWLELGKRHEHA